MSKKHTSDLHCHLNGSFSFEFLKKTAEKHNCLEAYEELVCVSSEYLQRTVKQPEEGFPGELISLVWSQFGLIHKIIQELTDISDGVVDVVQRSKAKYLEIRTTPKPMAKASRDEYIDAFEQGLLIANRTLYNKSAVGLISLDRTFHTIEDARYFIARIKESPNKLLIGLDICGNPLVKRTLSGLVLRDVVQLALNSGIPIAIHMAESDSDVERQDTDIILSVLEEWKSSQSHINGNPLYGIVRLGHCIYLTEQQKQRISTLSAPIEVCPTCHSKLNWHLEKYPHPVAAIYQDVSDPIVIGTDDEVIFGASIKSEWDSLLRFFTNVKKLTKKEIKEHQSNFRFFHEQYILAPGKMAPSGLLQIDSALTTLAVNIGEMSQHRFEKAYKKATELLSHLKKARDEYLQSLKASNLTVKQAGILFNEKCKRAINDAKPVLEKDVSWGDYLKNMLKIFYNALIKPFVSNSNAFFKLTRPHSLQHIEEAEITLQQLQQLA